MTRSKAIKKEPLKKETKRYKEEKKTKPTKKSKDSTFNINHVYITYNIKYLNDYKFKYEKNIFKDIPDNLCYIDCMIEAIKRIKGDIHTRFGDTVYKYFNFIISYDLNPEYYISFNSGDPDKSIKTEWTINVSETFNTNRHYKSAFSSNDYYKVYKQLSALLCYLRKHINKWKMSFLSNCIQHVDDPEFIKILDKPLEIEDKKDVEKVNKSETNILITNSDKELTENKINTVIDTSNTSNNTFNFNSLPLNRICLYGFMLINIILFYFVYIKFYI